MRRAGIFELEHLRPVRQEKRGVRFRMNGMLNSQRGMHAPFLPSFFEAHAPDEIRRYPSREHGRIRIPPDLFQEPRSNPSPRKGPHPKKIRHLGEQAQPFAVSLKVFYVGARLKEHQLVVAYACE